MYIPKYFLLKDESFINEIIETYSFATLISQHNGELYGTHMPLIWDASERVLYGHFSKKNEQWRDIEHQRVLVIFQGPHCYISSTWYETDRAVSTWNYVVVHLYGKVKRMTDQREIYKSLNQLTTKYEGKGSSNELSKIDSKYLEAMMKEIVPFKINVETVQAKAKLSQNHPKERQKKIIEKLEKSEDKNKQLISAFMKKNLMRDNRF